MKISFKYWNIMSNEMEEKKFSLNAQKLVIMDDHKNKHKIKLG